MLPLRSDAGVTGLTASPDDASSAPCELYLVAIVEGYLWSNNAALLLVLAFRFRFALPDEESRRPPNFSSSWSFLLRRMMKNAITLIRAAPNSEAMTAAAIRPGAKPELFLVPSVAEAPVDGVLVTVWVTTLLPLKVTTWTLVTGLALVVVGSGAEEGEVVV